MGALLPLGGLWPTCHSPGGKEGGEAATFSAPVSVTGPHRLHTLPLMMRPPPETMGQTQPRAPLSPCCVPENSPQASTPRRGHTDSPPASPARSLPRPGPCPPVSAALTPTLALAWGPERAGGGGPAARGPRPAGQDTQSLRGPHTQRASAPASASHVQPPGAVLRPALAAPSGEPGPAGRGAPCPSQDPRPQPR